MAVTLTLTGKRPGQPQFGLATFTKSFKCDAAADVVLVDPSVPQEGDPDATYPFMFVTDRYVTETGESASILDLAYMGCLTDDGEGNPILPTQKASSGG